MSPATYTFLFGALIGLIVGLGICYWKQISSVYQNRDKITSAANLYDAVVGVKDSF